VVFYTASDRVGSCFGLKPSGDIITLGNYSENQ